MCALSAARPAATFPRPWCASRSRLSVGVRLCDRQSPQQNGFVERSHRTYQEECLAVERPETLQEVREVTAQFGQHDNWQRPHQGLSCGNRPPRVAFPTLPQLPAVPDVVDPDRWREPQ
jgi:transposase